MFGIFFTNLLTTQELTLVSYLLKNLVERADRDRDEEVTIEEILAFDDFEFIESVFPVVPELAYPGGSLDYLVRPNNKHSTKPIFLSFSRKLYIFYDKILVVGY